MLCRDVSSRSSRGHASATPAPRRIVRRPGNFEFISQPFTGPSLQPLRSLAQHQREPTPPLLMIRKETAAKGSTQHGFLDHNVRSVAFVPESITNPLDNAFIKTT